MAIKGRASDAREDRLRCMAWFCFPNSFRRQRRITLAPPDLSGAPIFEQRSATCSGQSTSQRRQFTKQGDHLEQARSGGCAIVEGCPPSDDGGAVMRLLSTRSYLAARSDYFLCAREKAQCEHESSPTSTSLPGSSSVPWEHQRWPRRMNPGPFLDCRFGGPSLFSPRFVCPQASEPRFQPG